MATQATKVFIEYISIRNLVYEGDPSAVDELPTKLPFLSYFRRIYSLIYLHQYIAHRLILSVQTAEGFSSSYNINLFFIYKYNNFENF